MRYKALIWSEDGELYKAVYSAYFEIITVRELNSKKLIYRKTNVSSMEWAIFKLRILKWKKPVQDVGNY